MDHFSYIDRVASYILRTDNLIDQSSITGDAKQKLYPFSTDIAGKAINRFRIRGCVGVLKVKQYNVSNRCVVFYCCCTLSCCNIIVCGCSSIKDLFYRFVTEKMVSRLCLSMVIQIVFSADPFNYRLMYNHVHYINSLTIT